MAQEHAPHVTPAQFGRIVPPRVVTPTAPAVRSTTVAARTPVLHPPPHPGVYQPWAALIKEADTRYRTEITAALSDLERAMSQAGQLLDVSAAEASEAAAVLEGLAYTAWSKYMGMADATRNVILDRARTAYDQAISYAQTQYDAALTDAEKTHKSIVADANRAKTDAGTTAA